MNRTIVNDASRVKRSASTDIECVSTPPIRKIYAGLCYDRPSVWTGLGSVLDVGGTIGRGVKAGGSRKANRLAIASDWYAVGADLYRSFNAFASRRSIKVGHGKSKRSI
jgi:hypothetical protein